jgi:phosphoglycolate phosphatase-like HAD superfamily hydrolase
VIKAIILDVGGTLLGATDLLENILACNANIKAHDDIYKQLENEFFRQVVGCRNGSMFKKVVEMIEGAIEVVNKENNDCLPSVNAKQVYWNTFVTDSFVINDADLALENFNDQKIELIIASDADAELIYAQFEKHKWNKYISKYFISSEINAYKPSDVFVSALSSAISNYEKNEVVLVGDSDVDIETGKKLGVKTALIIRNNQKQYNEDYSITSLLQLLDT